MILMCPFQLENFYDFMKTKREEKKKVQPPLHCSLGLKLMALRKILEAKANSKGGFGREIENQLYKLACLPSQQLLCVPALKAFSHLSFTFLLFQS